MKSESRFGVAWTRWSHSVGELNGVSITKPDKNDYQIPDDIFEGLKENKADKPGVFFFGSVSKPEMVEYLVDPQNGDGVISADEAAWLNIDDTVFRNCVQGRGTVLDPVEAPSISLDDLKFQLDSSLDKADAINDLLFHRVGPHLPSRSIPGSILHYLGGDWGGDFQDFVEGD